MPHLIEVAEACYKSDEAVKCGSETCVRQGLIEGEPAVT